MARQAMFDGLVYDDYDNLLTTTVIGDEAQYVFDDDGFRRHIDAEVVDRELSGRGQLTAKAKRAG